MSERATIRDTDTDPHQPDLPPEDRMPDRPTKLGAHGIWETLKRTVKEFQNDNLTDWAAALTYYGVLSIFPGMIVLTSAFGLIGDGDTAKRAVDEVVPPEYGDQVNKFLTDLSGTQGAGILAVVGILGALWSASGYVSAFMRASNSIYDVPEGRPVWKTVPVRLGITVAIGLLLIASATIVVFTGPIAEKAGDLIGLGAVAVTAWDIAKWPVLVFIVSTMFALLYWASPNARHGGFRWISPGGILAVFVWLLASTGFAFYVAGFSSYNKTYGTLGGVIAFLVWLWISNIAVLLGAEFDAELERGRAIQAGHPEDEEPYIKLRDTRKVKEGQDQNL